tara:strand:+ start:103 stop:699 length:597 start_codon:yes stop_codon:yes gene_type:complete
MSAKHEITRADILSMEQYGAQRKQRRQAAIAMKKHRRFEVGPLATFYFENYDTMLAQIHEMLWIERGGEEQLTDELAAYNPLVPKGSELVATLMFEIDDPVRRDGVLRRLGGVEHTVSIEIGDEIVRAIPDEQDGVERTKDDGKTSSIHFLHFPFTAAQVEAFRSGESRAVLAIAHDNYAHMAVIPAHIREALAADFD